MESRERYVRQIMLDGWGVESQQTLARSRVCVAGLGGLGAPVSLYLAAAGVGTIAICDDGTLELSNLNRQILYDETDIGHAKVDRAAERMRALNRSVNIEPHGVGINDETVASICSGADLIVDCLDNFDARYVLNRYSVREGVPLLHAAVSGYYGQLALLRPPQTPCLECFIPVGSSKATGPPPVLGAAVGVIGSIEALMAIDALRGETDDATLLTVDLVEFSIERTHLERNPGCPVCSG